MDTPVEKSFAAQWLAYTPLSTLRVQPRGCPRMTRGQCGSLLLHRKGLAPSTPCRSPGASHTFPETGKFIGIVTVKNTHGQTYVSQFPFSVGQSLGKSMGIYAAMVVVLVAAVYLLWHLGRKQKPVLPNKPA